MSFDRSPISQVDLPGISIGLNGLILLVGPNSSGKTSLLRDIHAVASGAERKLVVADRIAFRQPLASIDNYLTSFLNSGDIERINQPGQPVQYRKRGHQLGTPGGGAPGTTFTSPDLQNWYERTPQHVSSSHGKTMPGNMFLQQLGVLECSALFIEHRLLLTQTPGTFDTHNAPPATAVQALRLNPRARDLLTQEILRIFQRGLWLDISGGGTLPLRVSDTASVPTIDEMTDPQKMKNYPTIEMEGEGIRSYVAICITLLLAQRPLCLIDEPEMCLHPPQARAIGNFIGRYGATPNGATVVATHSSEVLRGVLQTNPQARVIRLTRREGSFHGQQVDAETLKQATARPFSRSEVILDGLFTEGVVLCESEGDRVVYESTLQTLEPPQPDVRFIPVGGVGGFKAPIGLYQALGVPVAVVGDLDFLFKPELAKVLEVLGAVPEDVSQLSGRSAKLRQDIMAIKPELLPDAAIEELRPLLSDPRNWDTPQKEASLKTQLNKVVGKLNRLSALKSKGIDGAPVDLRKEVDDLVGGLKRFGLFLVPRGELESWVPNLLVEASKENKPIWATEAARKIEEHGQGTNDIWDFVKDIVAFIRSRLATTR